MSRIPRPIGTHQAGGIWYWIRQVGPDDGVLVAYEVTAPLSSRKLLFSYVLEQNKARGIPQVGPEFQWVFLRNKDFDPTLFRDQGFAEDYQGDFLTILQKASLPRNVTLHEHVLKLTGSVGRRGIRCLEMSR
jgi:hypothetical protein